MEHTGIVKIDQERAEEALKTANKYRKKTKWTETVNTETMEALVFMQLNHADKGLKWGREEKREESEPRRKMHSQGRKNNDMKSSTRAALERHKTIENNWLVAKVENHNCPIRVHLTSWNIKQGTQVFLLIVHQYLLAHVRGGFIPF